MEQTAKVSNEQKLPEDLVQEVVAKEPKALTLNQLNKKLLKTLKKGKKELTQDEIRQLDELYKQEFFNYKMTLSHLLYSDLSEKNKKQTVILEDSRLPNGLLQIKKKFPTLKQILTQINTQFSEDLLNQGKYIQSIKYTNVNEKVDYISIEWRSQ